MKHYQDLGYVKGRGLVGEQERIAKMLKSRSYVVKPETIEKIKQARAKQIMKIAVNNGVDTCYISKDELQQYLDKGYMRGRALKPLDISEDIQSEIKAAYTSG